MTYIPSVLLTETKISFSSHLIKLFLYLNIVHQKFNVKYLLLRLFYLYRWNKYIIIISNNFFLLLLLLKLDLMSNEMEVWLKEIISNTQPKI